MPHADHNLPPLTNTFAFVEISLSFLFFGSVSRNKVQKNNSQKLENDFSCGSSKYRCCCVIVKQLCINSSTPYKSRKRERNNARPIINWPTTSLQQHDNYVSTSCKRVADVHYSKGEQKKDVQYLQKLTFVKNYKDSIKVKLLFALYQSN